MTTLSTLALHNRSKLLEQLLSGECDDELGTLWNGISYPHHLAVNEFVTATTAAARREWLECLKLFVAKKAPANRPEELETVSLYLVVADWSVAPDVMTEMAKLYVAAGYVGVNERLPGKSFDKPHLPGGKPILGAAISVDNPHAVEFLLSAGATMVLGTRRSDCMAIRADDYAHAVGAKRCAALFERQLVGVHDATR